MFVWTILCPCRQWQVTTIRWACYAMPTATMLSACCSQFEMKNAFLMRITARRLINNRLQRLRQVMVSRFCYLGCNMSVGLISKNKREKSYRGADDGQTANLPLNGEVCTLGRSFTRTHK